MIIRIYDYNGKDKLVKIPDDCEYIEFDILNGDMVLTYPIQVDAYLAVMKDIRDPDFKEGTESNWSITLKSIMNSVNS